MEQFSSIVLELFKTIDVVILANQFITLEVNVSTDKLVLGQNTFNSP